MYVYKYSVDVYLLCMIKVRVRWYSVKNVTTSGKLLLLFCLPLLLLKCIQKQQQGMSSLALEWNGNHFSSMYICIYVYVCIVFYGMFMHASMNYFDSAMMSTFTRVLRT